MKLHLGCGKVKLPGFYNIDLSDYEHVDLRADIRDLQMFENGSIEMIYVSATFQYFDRNEGKRCLKEWYRVLKKGGKLRISTVDFDKLLLVYKKSQNDFSKISGPLYGKMDVEDRQLNPIQKIYHKTVYTRRELDEVLKKTGFTDIKEYDWRKTESVFYDDQSQSYFPHMDKLNGIVNSLLTHQTSLNKELVSHFHFSPFDGLPTTISPSVQSKGIKTVIDHLVQVKRSLTQHKTNLATYKEVYLSQKGKFYINSRYNNTN